MALLGFGRGNVADGFEQAPVIELVHPFESGVLDGIDEARDVYGAMFSTAAFLKFVYGIGILSRHGSRLSSCNGDFRTNLIRRDMYPLSDQGLAVFEVVEHWMRSIPEHPTFQELVTRLLQAYWRGDLQIHPPSNPQPTEPVALLRVVHDYVNKRSDSEDFEIVFYEEENELPEDLVELPDGSMVCDNRTRIRLPHDPNHWTPDVLAQAFEQLQTLEFQALPRQAMTGFLASSVDRDVFGDLCDDRGWPGQASGFRAVSAGSPQVPRERPRQGKEVAPGSDPRFEAAIQGRLLGGSERDVSGPIQTCFRGHLGRGGSAPVAATRSAQTREAAHRLSPTT